MGRDLDKLRAQITIDLDGTATLNLRGPEAKTLILTVTQEEEWHLYALEGRPPEIPELPFKIPGVGQKITPQIWPKTCPSSGGTKAWGHPHQPKPVLHSPQGPGQNSKTLTDS
jgi:hypothetical protein